MEILLFKTLPFFIGLMPIHNVSFFVITKENQNGTEVFFNNTESIYNSTFNPEVPTRVLIHGWRGGRERKFATRMIDAYLNYNESNFNLIFVDWSQDAKSKLYPALVVSKVKKVGMVVARFLNFMNNEGFLNFNETAIIGYSLGAHIAGIAGKNINQTNGKISTIIGLDPASPIFSKREESNRLTKNDADYVEVIHSNTRGYGIYEPLGHTDFYLNGKTEQPECVSQASFYTRFNKCSHQRAVQFFTESLKSNAILVKPCRHLNDLKKQCPYGDKFCIRSEPSQRNYDLHGIFYIDTNDEDSFEKDVYGICT